MLMDYLNTIYDMVDEKKRIPQLQIVKLFQLKMYLNNHITPYYLQSIFK